MSAVTFSAVAKRFGHVQAVAGPDLDIEAGSTLALLGPNGAGESTSIGMLLGQNRPDTGGVAVFGGTPDEAVAAGQVGAMLQDALIPGVTVREITGRLHLSEGMVRNYLSAAMTKTGPHNRMAAVTAARDQGWL